MKKTFVFVVLDGWGIGAEDASNPIHVAQPNTIRYIESHFPAGALQASGITVGLPWEEEGNSEVGHVTLGAGKVLYQHYPRISLAVRDHSFFLNPRLKAAFAHAREKKTAVHLFGLLTSGIVHAAMEHLTALIRMAKLEQCSTLYLHLITDGRDSAPKSAAELIKKIEALLQETGAGEIASIVGRYYAMDRDQHWDRTEKAYTLLTQGKGAQRGIEESLRDVYERDLNDEYVEPTIPHAPHPIQTGDAVIFFNFREDRMQQISEAFLNPFFGGFPVTPLKDVFVATMTQYHKEIEGYEAYAREIVTEPIGKILADQGKIQLRIAETEKYAHVTYFFNGLREEPFPNEYRILIPSQSVSRHDEKPEMMATSITDRALAAIQEGSTDFILVNFANADMIAHTGNFEATVQAVKVIDQELERLVRLVLDGDHTMIITADHGNAEMLLDLQTGEKETRHNGSPVPFYLIGREFMRNKTRPAFVRLPVIGMLADVAPTALELMGLPKSKDMTGESLMPQLR